MTATNLLAEIAPTEMFYLLCNRVVPKALYDEVFRQVEIAIPFLEPGFGYTTEKLCGDDFWQTLSDGDRRKAGQCLADIVERGNLPLIPFLHQHEYPRKYQLK